jgi:hypothetical protein
VLAGLPTRGAESSRAKHFTFVSPHHGKGKGQFPFFFCAATSASPEGIQGGCVGAIMRDVAGLHQPPQRHTRRRSLPLSQKATAAAASQYPSRGLTALRQTGRSPADTTTTGNSSGAATIMSPPITLPDSVTSAPSHDVYRKAANDLDELLDVALGEFGSAAGGSFGRGGSVASSTGNLSSFGGSNAGSAAAFEVADDGGFAAASRQERYHSLLAFHRWCWLLCSVDPSFAVAAKRQRQVDSWALSASFSAWALLRSRSSGHRGSRPTSPVDQPSARAADAVHVSAAFGAWAGEARARAQERVTITSRAIGLWCAYTQRARRMHELGVAADAISHGRELLRMRQILVLWASVASESAKHALTQSQFAERWATKKHLWWAFLSWRSFRTKEETDLEMVVDDDNYGDNSGSVLDSQIGDMASFRDSVNGGSVSPIGHAVPGGKERSPSPPSADAIESAAAEPPKPAGSRLNPALDTLGNILHAEADTRKLLAKADRFYASRQSVRMVFFFTVWAQLRGTMTPRERQPPQATSSDGASPSEQLQEPDSVQVEQQQSPAQAKSQAQVEQQSQQPQQRDAAEDVRQSVKLVKPAPKKPADDPEQWLMRQAGVLSSSDDESSDDDDTDRRRSRGGLQWADDEDVRLVVSAESAVAAMLEGAGAPATAAGALVSDDEAEEHEEDCQGDEDVEEGLNDASDDARDGSSSGTGERRRTARQEQLVLDWSKRQHHRLSSQPQPQPQPEATTSSGPAPAAGNIQRSDGGDEEEVEISVKTHLSEWISWYFHGEWWPAPDVDVALQHVAKQLLLSERFLEHVLEHHAHQQLRNPSATIGGPVQEEEDDDDASAFSLSSSSQSELSMALTWEAHLVEQIVWYLHGDWLSQIARAHRTVPRALARHADGMAALAEHSAGVALVGLRENAVVVGGAVLWEAVATGLVFTSLATDAAAAAAVAASVELDGDRRALLSTKQQLEPEQEEAVEEVEEGVQLSVSGSASGSAPAAPAAAAAATAYAGAAVASLAVGGIYFALRWAADARRNR